MNQVKLGCSGLHVSQIALGCMSYGDPKWRPWTLDEEQARPFFKRALEAGINFFDTADIYSLGQSEKVTGALLKDMARRDEVVIATKVGLEMAKEPNAKGLSRKHILEGINASLKRLGTDYVDLYQIHRLDRAVPMEEICAALDRAVQDGKVLYLGASSMHGWEFATLLGLQRMGGLARFASMQNHYNLLYREEEREMVPLCLHEGIGLIPWSPLARGLLTRPAQHQSTARSTSDQYSPKLYGLPHEADILAALERAAKAHGHAMAQIALAWLMAKPGVSAPIVGATKLSQLEDAIGATAIKLDAETMAALEQPYRPRPVAGID